MRPPGRRHGAYRVWQRFIEANVKEAQRCARLAAQIAQSAGAKSVAVLSWYNAQARFEKLLFKSSPSNPL